MLNVITDKDEFFPILLYFLYVLYLFVPHFLHCWIILCLVDFVVVHHFDSILISFSVYFLDSLLWLP